MTLDPGTRRMLASVRTIDLVTVGRKTSMRREVEIWWFHLDDRFVVTGTPGPRDWYANVLADPRVWVRVRGDEYEGLATPITDAPFRRSVFTDPSVSWYSTQAQLERLVRDAPMIEIDFD